MSGTLKLAVRNVVRQKSHTAMTLAAITFGVVGLIVAGGWVEDIFEQLGEALIHSQSGHAQIYKKGFFEAGSRSPEKYLVAEPEKLKQAILQTDGVASAMARLNFSGLLNNGRSDLPVVGEGVEADKEAELGSFVTFVAGRQMTATDTFGAVIGV